MRELRLWMTMVSTNEHLLGAQPLSQKPCEINYNRSFHPDIRFHFGIVTSHIHHTFNPHYGDDVELTRHRD
jgi:hypothetical protein